MKKLALVILALGTLLAGRGSTYALSDCCTLADYATGGAYDYPPTIPVGPVLGNAVLFGDTLWVFFAGGGLNFEITSPSGVTSSFGLYPYSSNFIQQADGVIGKFEPGYFDNQFQPGSKITSINSFDPVSGVPSEPAGEIGFARTVNSGGVVTSQVLNGPAGPPGHGGGAVPHSLFEQFIDENLKGNPGVVNEGPNGVIMASGAPCDIDEAYDPCITHVSWSTQGLTGKTFVLYRDVSPPGWNGVWYQFSQPSFSGKTQVTFTLVEGHTFTFRLIDMGGAQIAETEVGYGSYGDLSSNSDETLIAAEAKPQVTAAQVWLSCTNWGNSNWYLWAVTGNPDNWQGGAGWMPAAPNYCTVNLYDTSNGSRLMRTRRFQYHSTGFAPVQAPSSSPPADIAARKGKLPAANNWKPQPVNSPKYTGPVQ